MTPRIFVTQPIPEPALARLRAIYPEKCDYVGEPAIRALIPRGVKLARSYSLASDFGVAFLIGLMFALGHGVAHDPKFPWIDETLKDEKRGDPDERARQLHATIKGLFEYFLVLMNKA